MSEVGRSWRVFALGVTALLLALPAPASAHETRKLERLHLTIGWGDEPTFTGSRNSVEVDVSDAASKPVTDPAGSLSVEVSFGDQRMVLPLLPAGDRPGRFRAWLVPTRPGTYTFHITGTLQGQPIDATSTCSDQTFDCVRDATEIQFPAKDPSVGEVAERVSRTLPRAERALEAAGNARSIAIAAIVVAALALAAAIGLGARKGRKGA